ncbi:MAG: hypothetical protein IJW13_05825 [Clostridia bacterium]|nr:hypothetical protein [Clostridia bacterium]
MLSKLYKHEFKALLRWFIPIWCAIIALSILNRVSSEVGNLLQIGLFSEEYNQYELPEILVIIYSVFSTSLTVLYSMGIMAAFVLCIIVIALRFYKNLFTSEGYFTFTLPFTPMQHLVCKLLCGVIMFIASVFVVLTSLLIVGVGTDVFNEFITQNLDLLNVLIQSGSGFSVFMLFNECVILLLLSIFVSLLGFYCSISFGQAFRNKIGGSILSYLIISAISEAVLSAVVTVIMIVALIFPQFFEWFGSLDTFVILHAILWFMIALYAGMGLVFFKITHKRMATKLNLN